MSGVLYWSDRKPAEARRIVQLHEPKRRLASSSPLTWMRNLKILDDVQDASMLVCDAV